MKEFEVTIYISELLYDIKSKTYLRGESLRDVGSSAEFSSRGQLDDEEWNEAEVLRSISKSIADARVLLHEWVVDNRDESVDNVLIGKEDDPIFILSVPDSFNDSGRQAVAESIHNMIVSRAIGDWYHTLGREESPSFIADSVTYVGSIRSSLSKRVRPSRPL